MNPAKYLKKLTSVLEMTKLNFLDRHTSKIKVTKLGITALSGPCQMKALNFLTIYSSKTHYKL